MAETIKFGEFIRKRRKALGISLREFCRRNGLDPANISRLERDLINPPRGKDILESYAKSLRLEPGSSDWNKFFEIAVDDRMREILPEKRGYSGYRRKPYTTAVKLERWADEIGARFALPQLIRRLIHATVDTVELVDFPAGEGVGRPGWDGIIRTQKGNAFVPSGQSGWEMGVGQDPKRKANDDFRNRSKNTGGLDPKETVFIFVTPRKWINKNEWCEEKKKLAKWKDVRVYDSDNLEQWLEIAPVVDAWFGPEKRGTDLDEYWENLKLFTEPSLKPEVFLTTRGTNIETLKQWISGSPSLIEFEATSPDDLLDFVAAYIASLDEPKRDEIKADRIVIVDNKEAWWALIASKYPIVLIPKPAIAVEEELITEALRRGHYVLLWKELTNDPQKKGTRLSRVYTFELESALESSGIKKEEARRLARESGGSLTVLKRRIARFPSLKTPEWALPKNASELVPILMAGNWDDVLEGDRRIIAELASQSYEEVEKTVNKWQKEKDAPIMKVLSHWRFVSREDSWALLASHITPGKLERFEQVALEVLSEEDPMYGLPPEKRWHAAVYNKIPKYSNLLRKGIAETLALLGAKSPPGLISGTSSPERITDRVVEKLLSQGASWQRWASLSDFLPILAEASPEEFLKAVENDLVKTEPCTFKLFAEQGEPLFSPTPQVGLLWALETLAWERRYLTRVSKILAHLATDVSPAKSGNNPMNSLSEIFLPWLPQTTASVEERIKVLRKVSELFPDIGVQLLLSLLPTYHGVSNFTHRPLWRDWALSWSDRVLLKDRWQQEEACAELLLEFAGTSIDRLLQLIKKFESFPPPAQDRLLSSLKNFDLESTNTKAKQQIVDILREKVSKHRRFSDANWALPAEIVDKLEEMQNLFEPEDLVARYIWLFVPYPNLPDKTKRDFGEEYEGEVLIQRKRVLSEILDSKGLAGIVELAESVELPDTIGYVIARANLIDSDDEILPTLLVAENDNISTFASGYARGRFANNGWEWVDSLPLAEWSAESVGKLALILDFNRQTWDLVSFLGDDISEYYWSRVRGFCREPKKEDVQYTMSMLIKYNRPLQAIDVIDKAIFHECELDSSLIMDTLEAGLDSWQDEKNREPIPKHKVQQVIKKLQNNSKNDPNFDIRRLASLEWGYLGFLDGHGASPITLQEFLQNDPKFFADLLTLIYRPHKEESDSAEPPTEKQKAKTESAYELLYNWRTIPGTREDGAVDEQILLNWVNQSREICRETDHLEVCDVKIGELLAHAPEEADGSWPCIPVRDVIEEIGSNALEEGFEVGIFNKRGTVTRSLFEGGEQERELAKKYKSYAEACAIEWPRTASVLRQLAKSYEQYARREDERAKEWL
jgi:transcriptional regulator with XRE-family HTH domain